MVTVDAVLLRLHGVRPAGRGWRAPCPAHGGRSRTLSIGAGDDGQVLLCCFAGCTTEAIVDALGIGMRDLWPGRSQPHAGRPHFGSDAHPPARALRTWSSLVGLWNNARTAGGTVAERYLQHRGITIPCPATIRFVRSSPHRPTGTRWPAMLSLVERQVVSGRVPVALHRTFLQWDGASKAPVEPSKMALGPVGGAAVMLAEPGEVLVVAEGIETALSVFQEAGLPTWAALSAGGIERLVLPPMPLASEVIIAADNDPVGLRAARRAADLWSRQGRCVRVAVPPGLGCDFNDLLEVSGG